MKNFILKNRTKDVEDYHNTRLTEAVIDIINKKKLFNNKSMATKIKSREGFFSVIIVGPQPGTGEGQYLASQLPYNPKEPIMAALMIAEFNPPQIKYFDMVLKREEVCSAFDGKDPFENFESI